MSRQRVERPDKRERGKTKSERTRRGVKVLEGQDKRSRGKTKSKGARQKVKGPTVKG